MAPHPKTPSQDPQPQPPPQRYPVRAWVDRAADSVRVDFNGGEQQALFVKVCWGGGGGVIGGGA
jgi:hypothetical protein